MKVIELELPGLKLIEPRVFRDARGFLIEAYSSRRYREAGIDVEFVQDNHSRSLRGTLRGLHFQSQPGQAKLVRVVNGRIYDVALDVRPSSPTFGRWHGVHLDSEEHRQLYIPVGFAHGFCVLSEFADVEYKLSNFYDAASERGVRPNDPELGIPWPIEQPILSERDLRAESFADLRSRLGR